MVLKFKNIFKELIRKKVFLLFQSCLVLLFPFFGGLLMSNTHIATYNAKISSLAKQGMDSDYSKILMQFSVDSKETNKSVVDSIFQRSYGQNFDGHATQIICSSENNQLLNYTCSFDGFEISKKTTLCTTLNYTNANKRFECICIELLKIRDKKDELYRPEWANGCVFLPDVFGDRIIEQCPQFSCYDDVLISETPFYIHDENGNERAYKIANFFHVYGFNEDYISSGESYLGSDYKFGTMLSGFLGDYVLSTDNSLFSSPSKSFVVMDDSKRFQIDYYLDYISSYSKKCSIDAKCFKTKNGEPQQIQGFQNLIQINYDGAEKNEIFPIIGFTFMLVLILFSCFLMIYNSLSFNKTTISFLAVDLALLLFASGTIELLKVSLFGDSAVFLSIFSLFYGLTVLFELISLISALARWLYVQKK